jgi:hypothetical protein
LVFEPVSLKLANVNETTQTKFPVTRGENCQLNFEILGIKDGTIYMADASSSTMSATASGLTASVVVPTSAISASRLSFGVKNAKNQKLLDDNGNEFTCDITLQPANPNTYNSNGTSQGVYIPYVSQISSFDSTKSEPQENQEVVIYDTAGKKLTYTYVKVSGNWRYKVTREADGSTYLYDSMARKWQKQ